MDLKLYEFIRKLRKEADNFEEIGNGESLRASGGYYGKAEAYREIANMLEVEFSR
jgi:hypothetical protein